MAECACAEKDVKKCALVQKQVAEVKNMAVCACAEKDVKKFALVQKTSSRVKKHAHAHVQENMAECVHAQKNM